MTRTMRIRVLLLLLGVLWPSVAGIPASAQQAPAAAPPPVRFDPTIRVGTDPDGVTTQIDVIYTSPGAPSPTAPASPGQRADAPAEAPRCTVTSMDGPPTGAGPPPEGSAYATVQCAGEPGYGFTTVLLPTDEADEPVLPAVTVDPEAVARTLRDRLPVPPVTIEAAPARALVGQETWFWLTDTDGASYQGAPIRRAATLAGVTVEVEAVPTSYRWDFEDSGPDGTQTTSSTGRPYPTRSPIRHTYQRAATGSQVTCDFAFTVRWRQPGGPWAALAPITRTVELTLPVAQSQGALTR